MRRQFCDLAFALALLACLPLRSAFSAEIPVTLSAQAASVERAAAAELAGYLAQLYPQDRFVLADQLPASGPAILIGSVPTEPRLRELLPALPSAPESYVVATAAAGRVGVVAGADPRGVVYAVYGLLEKLGCGFYLSYDAIAPPRSEPFSFQEWQLSDRPLVADRLVFDWHNFLSGCSTWNLPDWKAWTLQSQKQNYNAIMVHAYGNNPMVSFTYGGQAKPVGYLSTTVKGRDWSTMHVNDVRRLWGGEVFSQPVFGADAALAPDDHRADAAQQLMQQVFAHARDRSMDVYFADDVDTGSANPQELILTLPESARFAIQAKAGGLTGVSGDGDRRFWLANPDTPEGYAYYRAQVESLLTAYPQITCLVVWFRNGGTPWMDLKLAEMPAAWQQEYQTELARTPAAASYPVSHSMFAIAKIVRAFDRALKELGHDRVELATGTWRFDFLPAADRFMPRHVKFIGLDYNILHDQSQLGTSDNRQFLAAIGARRKVLPVIWAHHDDGNYIGRPYTPFADFHAKLAESRASGFGIIHWTTRPLDLHFASHIRQVWQATKNQPLRVACDRMARRSFGASAAAQMADYLECWVTDAPKFARETSDRFIDRPLTDIPAIVAGCRARLELIASVDQSQLIPDQRERLEYFRGLEQFIAAFYETHALYQAAEEAAKQGDAEAARRALAECRPQPLIEEFARFSARDTVTRGEQGLVVSLNTRWLPHIVRLRQSLGLEPIRYNFGPTSHDPLAQSPGRYTFHFDSQRQLWQTLGAAETGAETFTLPADAQVSGIAASAAIDVDICRTGIQSDRPITLKLAPILRPAPLTPGRYILRLAMLDPTSTASGQRVFDVSIQTGSSLEEYAFEPVKGRYLRLECHGNSENNWNSIQEVRLDSLARSADEPLAVASAARPEYPAAHAIDGKPETRWAIEGPDHWIQFRLDPQKKTSAIGILWFGGRTRKPAFDISVSNDGQNWTRVANLHPTDSPASSRRVDIFREVGQPNRVLVQDYPVQVLPGGQVELTLTPITGKAILSAATLDPAAPE